MSEQTAEYWPFPVLPPEQRSEQHWSEVRFLDDALREGFRPCKFLDGEYRVEADGGRTAWVLYRGRLRGGTATRWEVWLNEGSDRIASFWVDEFASAAAAALRWARGHDEADVLTHFDGHTLHGPGLAETVADRKA